MCVGPGEQHCSNQSRGCSRAAVPHSGGARALKPLPHAPPRPLTRPPPPTRRPQVRMQQRNGRKSLTTVQGLPEAFDYKKILKALKKGELECRGLGPRGAGRGRPTLAVGRRRLNGSSRVRRPGGPAMPRHAPGLPLATLGALACACKPHCSAPLACPCPHMPCHALPPPCRRVLLQRHRD